MSARIRQVPGWWPSLVQAVCDACGWTGPVRSLNEGWREEVLVKLDRDQHECAGGTR